MPLNDATITDRLNELPGWAYSGSAIHKTFELKGFLTAMTFANAIAHLATVANHHPDLRVHGYNKLTVDLTTHSEGGVTENDLSLAAKIEQLRSA